MSAHRGGIGGTPPTCGAEANCVSRRSARTASDRAQARSETQSESDRSAERDAGYRDEGARSAKRGAEVPSDRAERERGRERRRRSRERRGRSQRGERSGRWRAERERSEPTSEHLFGWESGQAEWSLANLRGLLKMEKTQPRSQTEASESACVDEAQGRHRLDKSNAQAYKQSLGVDRAQCNYG